VISAGCCQISTDIATCRQILVKISQFVSNCSTPGGSHTIPYGQVEKHGEVVIRYSLSELPKNVVRTYSLHLRCNSNEHAVHNTQAF
jgi:hypothetical protein